MIYLYYVLGFATGYVIRGIICDVKRGVTEQRQFEAMQAAQLRFIEEKETEWNY